jgi:hypothetical protein
MGSNLYRSTAPFSELRRKYNLELDVFTRPTFRWDEASYYDMAFFLWPNTEQVLNLMGNFKFMGVPLWVDFDDDPWNLPEDNPASKDYAEGTPVRRAIDFAVQEADLVTVSTHRLSYVLGAKNKNVQVIPNAYWDKMWPMSKAPRKKAILWRGALGHNKDLESVILEIVELQSKYPDWPWIFVGEANKDLIALLKPEQTITIPYQHPNAYIRTLIDLACPIQVVPLLNHEFNKMKSNCSWLEACCAGSAIVAPEYLQEFDKPGITRYQDPKDFKEKVERLIMEPELCSELVEKSRWAIGKDYLLSEVNEKRAKILGLK